MDFLIDLFIICTCLALLVMTIMVITWGLSHSTRFVNEITVQVVDFLTLFKYRKDALELPEVEKDNERY